MPYLTRTALILSSLLLSLQPMAALAQQQLSPQQILQQTLNRRESQGFVGKRRLKVYRQNASPLEAAADVVYTDRNNYNVSIAAPFGIKGIQFNMHKGVNVAYFPDEKLYLFNGGPNTSYMPERIILSQLVNKPELLWSNYTLRRAPDDITNLTATYVVDLIPKHTFTYNNQQYWQTPRRKYWIDKQHFHILQEHRYWDMSDQPYATAWYETFRKEDTRTRLSEPQAPGGTNQIDLSGGGKNSFLTYSTVAEAEAREKIRVATPSYLPTGFELKDIQVFTLFGARIQVLNYTDGLNDLMITIRPQQNAFVTLLAGAFSLNLIKKITDLSHQAPNNYHSTATENRIAVVFGDLHPVELQKVGASLTL